MTFSELMSSSDEENLGEEEVQESVEESDSEMTEDVPNVSTLLEYGPHKNLSRVVKE